jgi:hypothetical protein
MQPIKQQQNSWQVPEGKNFSIIVEGLTVLKKQLEDEVKRFKVQRKQLEKLKENAVETSNIR